MCFLEKTGHGSFPRVDPRRKSEMDVAVCQVPDHHATHLVFTSCPEPEFAAGVPVLITEQSR